MYNKFNSASEIENLQLILVKIPESFEAIKERIDSLLNKWNQPNDGFNTRVYALLGHQVLEEKTDAGASTTLRITYCSKKPLFPNGAYGDRTGMYGDSRVLFEYTQENMKSPEVKHFNMKWKSSNTVRRGVVKDGCIKPPFTTFNLREIPTGNCVAVDQNNMVRIGDFHRWTDLDSPLMKSLATLVETFSGAEIEIKPLDEEQLQNALNNDATYAEN